MQPGERGGNKLRFKVQAPGSPGECTAKAHLVWCQDVLVLWMQILSSEWTDYNTDGLPSGILNGYGLFTA